jgi:ATP-binding protein involved in chromosome partitioning
MGRNNFLRIVGVVENMSAFVNEQGTVYELFGAGGGAELAQEVGVPLLGQVPIDEAVAFGGDNGTPVVLGPGPAGDALRALVARIADEAVPAVEMAGCSARLLGAVDAALAARDAREADAREARPGDADPAIETSVGLG